MRKRRKPLSGAGDYAFKKMLRKLHVHASSPKPL
jgi:hypothetical protein